METLFTEVGQFSAADSDVADGGVYRYEKRRRLAGRDITLINSRLLQAPARQTSLMIGGAPTNRSGLSPGGRALMIAGTLLKLADEFWGSTR